MRKPIELPVKTQTVCMRTGKVTENKTAKMFMLPAKEGTCEICATKHEKDLPHNKQSLFYQTRFNAENGRSATWSDATAHCTPELRELWKEQLLLMGEKFGDEVPVKLRKKGVK